MDPARGFSEVGELIGGEQARNGMSRRGGMNEGNPWPENNKTFVWDTRMTSTNE